MLVSGAPTEVKPCRALRFFGVAMCGDDIGFPLRVGLTGTETSIVTLAGDTTIYSIDGSVQPNLLNILHQVG
jgi:hypothetical protein